VVVAKIDIQNRSPEVLVLPDDRLRVTRVADILNYTSKDADKFVADLLLPWGTPDETYPNCRLVRQTTPGQNENPAKTPNDPPPQLIRVYEEIDEALETQVGEPAVTYDQYDNKIVTIEFIQFSTGTAVYETVGSSVAPAPNTDAVLKEQIDTDDGTLRTIKRIYTTGGTMSDMQNLRFGGKVIVRTITSLNSIPATPAGYSLVAPGVTYPRGLPLYAYEFVASNGGGTPGTGGQISIDYYNAQGGAVSFNPAAPSGSDGTTRAVIRYVTAEGVTLNPIPTPAGFVLVGLEMSEDTGYILWTGTYYRGEGLVVDEVTVSEIGALVVYHRVQFGSAPTTPSATIGGTVTLFDSSTRQADGYVIYDYKWAEGDGQSDYTVEGESDGALTYTVVTYTLAASVPAYPGTGTGYNIRLQQKPGPAYFTNIAVWKKPPEPQTRNETVQFEKPGVAEFTGSPPQFLLTAPRTLTLLASVVVDYATSQISDVPFTVSAPASFYENYTPTDTGIAVTDTQALGRYLAQASGISGTNSVYNGVLCDEWAAQLISSVPSTFPTGATVLRTENTPYLTDINGTVVWKREKVSYTF